MTVPYSQQRATSFFTDLVKFAFIALLIILPFRLFIAQPFIVNGQSMTPTFDSGQYLIVDQISYAFQNPVRGDVVVFRFPEDKSKFFIKRIIGLPGETVTIENGSITIFNDEHPKGLELDEPYIDTSANTDMSVTLEPDEFFVMGDNREASSDSRLWGPLDRELIAGRPLVRLFPVGQFSILPGEYHR